ncbi:uncharacterized protein K460DRAFT_365083 [Cucurbitaria berberidis CBS 394.84]|uniref:Uncharacterized protein n=1 Tax=Cucurbitaria berberidis CBS 394.84 TaxID=1168544 RepID=A0A9P4LC01_9PLEO|nr:uncharacterized protein K460DRAFT_365083 [Cucurbitaria berberidis CBS 394.84]KAF1849173.1 hypothetical protein K460DRAFT_365083 [Cucurbitaria berberidis CBS 394.84]
MSTVFCYNCGNGPLNAAINAACPSCQHIGSNHAYTAGIGATSSNEYTSAGSGSFTERPEREPVYRWVCCFCHSSNSYNVDVGCPRCNNHWRQGCCQVFDANAKR